MTGAIVRLRLNCVYVVVLALILRLLLIEDHILIYGGVIRYRSVYLFDRYGRIKKILVYN